MKLGVCNLVILAVCLTTAQLSAAVVVTLVTPYRSLADSPWSAAVAGGDSLIFTSHNFQGCVDAVNQDTLPDGYGLYEDFEECFTPWVTNLASTTPWERSSNAGVDADDGVINGITDGHGIKSTPPFGASGDVFTITFTPTLDGKFPKWFGFASANANNTSRLEVMGIGGSVIEAVDLTALAASVGNTPFVAKFQGFILNQPITAVRF